MTYGPKQVGSGEYRGRRIYYDLKRQKYVCDGMQSATLDGITEAIDKQEKRNASSSEA